MDAEMAAQHLGPCKRLVAQPARDTHAWLLVVALVLFQVEHVHEGLATYGAQVLALAHVIALVSPKQAGVDEALAAQVAHVGARHRVVSDVYRQFERGREAFVTVWTLVQVFRRVTLAVNLQV